MKWNGTLTIGLAASNFCTAETTGNHNLYTLCTETHCTANALLHSTAESNTTLQLVSDVTCNQGCIHIRLLYLGNIDVNLVGSSELLNIFLNLLDSRTLAADNHTRLCSVDGELEALLGALGLNL